MEGYFHNFYNDTVAKGKFLSAINIATIAIRPTKHLKKCKNALLV